jgi:hypothetical protein
MTEYNDYDELERIAEERRRDRDADKLAADFQRLQQRQAMQKQQHDTMEVIRGFCEANGISQEEWQQAINDPEVARDAYLKSVRDYARRVTKRKRNSKGQFVKNNTPANAEKSGKWQSRQINNLQRDVKYNPSDNVRELAKSKDPRDQRAARDAMIDDIIQGTLSNSFKLPQDGLDLTLV